MVPQEYKSIADLTCRLCVFAAKNEYEIDNHIEAVHNQAPMFACEFCHFRTKTKNVIEEYVITHNKTDFTNKVCEDRAITEHDIEEHVKMKHVTVKVNIQINEQIVLACLQCEYKCRFNI